jgi:hypothetical protein
VRRHGARVQSGGESVQRFRETPAQTQTWTEDLAGQPLSVGLAHELSVMRDDELIERQWRNH